jgi:hypothetical protein
MNYLLIYYHSRIIQIKFYDIGLHLIGFNELPIYFS